MTIKVSLSAALAASEGNIAALSAEVTGALVKQLSAEKWTREKISLPQATVSTCWWPTARTS